MNCYCSKRHNFIKQRKVDGPDGVEAWCVALSACFINFVMAGLGRMSGILYVTFIDMFQVDRLQASVPFSVRSLARNLLGPIVGILGQKYGVRAVTLSGGIIGTLSAAACFHATSILWITIMWGVFNGAGIALSNTLYQVVLDQHFKKYRTTASGMAFSGGCVGSFLFPVLLEYLLYVYGVGGTFLIMAGIIMNVIPAALILRKPSWMKRTYKKNVEVSTIYSGSDQEVREPSGCLENKECGVKICNRSDLFSESKNRNSLNKRNSTPRDSHASLQQINSNIDTYFLRQKNELVIQLFTAYFDNKWNRTDKMCLCLYAENLSREFERMYCLIDESFICGGDASKTTPISSKSAKGVISESQNNYNKRNSTVDKNEVLLAPDSINTDVAKESMTLLLNKLLTEDVSKILKSFPEKEHEDIVKILKQLRTICRFLEGMAKRESSASFQKPNNIDCQKPEKREQIPKDPNTFIAHVKTSIRLHANPIFLLISLCRSAHFITFVPTITIVVDYAMDKGLLEEDGKYVIAALSFGDLVGRLCLGWVTDKEYLELPRYMLIVMIMQGICTACLSLMYSRAALLTLLSIFGLLQGSLFVRHPVLVSKYLGKNEQSVAMGCFNFFSGLLGFALPSYIGYFRDTIGSYDYIFYINGTIGSLIGIMWLFEPYFVKCIKSNEVQDESV